MNTRRAAAGKNAEIPISKGIQGDFVIKKDAIEGAIISANKPIPPPIRKTLALVTC
jgi:hypothetical protein